MSTPPVSKFDARSPADNARLLREHPFAWVVSADDAEHGNELQTTALPLQAQVNEQGGIVRLVGHFPRFSPHVEALKRQPRAMFLFLGPHGYISPSWLVDRTQTPTWNYASVRCRGTVRFHEDEQRLREELRALVDAQEAGREGGWSLDEMGERYAQLAQRIVGFEAEVEAAQGRFKLGQDERDDVFADIVLGLGAQVQGGADRQLLDWMLQFNKGRVAKR